MSKLHSLQIAGRNDWDRTNIMLGKWRVLTVLLLGAGYFLFYSRNPDWLLYWLGWFVYAALWLPLQGRHTGENPNAWTYFFLAGDILLFILVIVIENDILNNFSVILILPLFQYLLRYGRKMALYYVWLSTAAVGFICLAGYAVHPANHFVVVAVMLLVAYNEGLLVQENRDLRNQLVNLAIYDELTGLYNFRFFAQAIERELSLARRYNHQLTLLLIDIDSFKQINDAYGHEKGNLVLKALAAIILDCIRESDYAARYGGDELAIILPRTSLEAGHEAAERLRQRIVAHPFDFGNVTVSIGVSTFPEPSSGKDELIRHADMAMYTAKNKGKDRVGVYNPRCA